MGLQLRRAINVVLRTKSYILYRALMYGALCLCVIAYLALLTVIGAVFDAGAFWVLLIVSVGLALLLGIDGFVGEYVFYRLKAGHIALITEIIGEGQLPDGISQMKWARGRVLRYFSGVGVLAEVHQLLRGTLRAINRTLFDSSAVLPVPGMEGGMKCARRIVDFSQRYVEESAIAYAFKVKNASVFDSIRTAVVLYCHCWKVVLGNAVTLTLLSYAFTLAASVLVLIPMGVLARLDFWTHYCGADTQTAVRFILFAVGIFVGFAVKWAVFDPFACASMVLTFLEESQLVSPDPKWEEKVELAAPQFKELKERASRQSAEVAPDNQPQHVNHEQTDEGEQ